MDADRIADRYECVSKHGAKLITPGKALLDVDIKDLKDGTRRVDVKGEITGHSETRDVYLRDGTKAKVADYTLTDQSGSIKLTLWNDQLEMVIDGSKVEIGNGYVTNFRGEISLNVGRYGTLKVPDESAPSAIG